MIEKNIKIPMIVAIVLDAFSLFIVLALILGQGQVIQAFISSAPNTRIFPLRTVLAIVFRLLLFLIGLLTMLYYKGEHRRTVSVIFIAILILSSIASPYITIVSNSVNARNLGSAYYGAYSSLSSAISLCTSPLSAISAALYFIACGRYGISDTESTFDPNNYIQP